MKKLLLLALAIAPMFAFCQNQTVDTLSDGKRFWKYIPPEYTSNSTAYTVVIFLHGKGQRGNTLADMNKITSLVGTPPNYAKTQNFPFILLSPQLKTSNGGWYLSYVRQMISHANKKYRVKDIYIVGLSLGGGGTWVAATDATINEGPENWQYNNVKGVVTVCGTGASVRKLACNVVQNKLRVWSLHGSADTTVYADTTIQMINRINGCNPIASGAPVPELTIYPGEYHEIWEKAFSRTNDFHAQNIYQWIMSSNTGTPQANAGNDIGTTSSSITITGNGTDSDGTIASHQWTQVSGPNTATLSGSTTASLTVANLIPGVYKFRLQVSDNLNWPSTPDEIVVTVTNPPPVVNAGADQVMNEDGAQPKSFTGSATDDGTIATYQWTQIAGPTATLSNANTTTLSVSGLVGGNYIFRLTATDNHGGSNYDDVALLVNKLPIANAGVDLNITLPTNSATFTGIGTDPDGTIASYLWTQYQGPTTATITNATSSTVTVSNLSVGKYGFRLRVKDNLNASEYDYMTVTVQSGARQSTESVTLAELESQTKRCDDCSIVIYNMNGKRFYSGLFDYEQYKNVTQSLQLYCYTLIRGNQKIDAGKVLQKK